MENPEQVYEHRRKQYDTQLQTLAQQDQRIADLRLVVFIAGAIALFGSYYAHWWPWWMVWLPVLAFMVLVVWHDRVLRRVAFCKRAIWVYEWGLLRINGGWAGRGFSGDHLLDEHHPYAKDIDLFGSGSLFELLSIARTRAGEDALANWMRFPTDADTIRQRQRAVEALRPQVQLREDIQLLGEDVRAHVRPEVLSRWGTAPTRLAGGGLRAWLFALPVLLLAVSLTGAYAGTGPWPVAVVLTLQFATSRRLSGRVDAVAADVEEPRRDLRVLSQVMARFEDEEVTVDELKALQARFTTDGVRASVAIAQLARLADLMDARRNQFFAPIGFLLMWSQHFAVAMERWRSRYGTRLEGWLETVGELEALLSVSGLAFEQVDWRKPEVVSEHCLEADGLAHPLLGPEAIANDVALNAHCQLWIISGSNMSGKSTLLRAIGCNVVLATLGGPIRAHRFKLCPLQLGATMRVQDSLQDGTSRFFAEVKRLKQIRELAEGPYPLLFLIDEMLSGTNSHDRRVGSRGVIDSLLDSGALGLLTTHDLALTEMADGNGRAKNAHFQDQFEGDRWQFDYTLREGVVQKSNALALMRSVGLQV